MGGGPVPGALPTGPGGDTEPGTQHAGPHRPQTHPQSPGDTYTAYVTTFKPNTGRGCAAWGLL
jgi:hypothetical protein